MKQVLLCGCGNIGFRHLQSLTAINAAMPLRISVVEPAEALHPRISELAAGIGDTHEIEVATAIRETFGPLDLAIIATNAASRRAAYDALVTAASPRAVLLEKVLFTRISDVDAVGADLERRGIAGFVNCGRRAFGGYQALTRQIEGGQPADLTVTGVNFGLGSNLVHFLDLAEYLNGAPLVSLDLGGLAPGAATAKREGYVEIYGRAEGRLENGARVAVDCAPGEGVSIDLALSVGGRTARIDEAGGTITWAGEAAEPFATRFVSQMADVYAGLIAEGSCGLTPYDASARQHRHYLRELARHLGLPEADDTECRVS